LFVNLSERQRSQSGLLFLHLWERVFRSPLWVSIPSTRPHSSRSSLVECHRQEHRRSHSLPRCISDRHRLRRRRGSGERACRSHQESRRRGFDDGDGADSKSSGRGKFVEFFVVVEFVGEWEWEWE